MIRTKPIIPQRVRKIEGSFAFIEHRFLREGFWNSLDHLELLLYLFLIMVGDRKGISFYCYDRICTLLGVSVDDYFYFVTLPHRLARQRGALLDFFGPTR